MSDLGPMVVPCWTRHLGDVQIRLWTGYSWLEFGHEAHIPSNEVERLSEPLELTDASDLLALRLFSKIASVVAAPGNKPEV